MIDDQNILLVDENEEFVLAMTLMLVSKGYSVSSAGSLNQARAICRKGKTNLVIIGPSVKKKDNQLLTKELGKHIPANRILHISNFLPHEIERKRIQKDGEKYITKNYYLDRIYDQVASALGASAIGTDALNQENR